MSESDEWKQVYDCIDELLIETKLRYEMSITPKKYSPISYNVEQKGNKFIGSIVIGGYKEFSNFKNSKFILQDYLDSNKNYQYLIDKDFNINFTFKWKESTHNYSQVLTLKIKAIPNKSCIVM